MGYAATTPKKWRHPHPGAAIRPDDAMALRHRSYSPTVMRWMEEDPFGYVDGLHLYAFESNNPLTHLDPSGKVKIADLIAASYSERATHDNAARQRFIDHAHARLQAIRAVVGSEFQGTEGMFDYDGYVASDASAIRYEVNASISPSIVAYAANKALHQLGLHYAAGIGTSEKASIDSVQGAALWREHAFAAGGTVMTISAGAGGSARAAPLGSGWNLKLYCDGSATYRLAVLPQNDSLAHIADAISYELGTT